MYESYFGFREKPFSIAPDPRFMYLSPAHEEALGHLFYGVNEPGGFVLLTGEVGIGKTTLVRALLERLPDSVDVALILNPKLSPTEFVAAVCDELRVGHPPGATLKTLVDGLNRHLLRNFASARRTVLVIDEAQALAPDVLEQIRLLTNLETTREKLLEIILVGQPELRTTLSRPDLRQLAQRITARYHLSPLGRREVERYVAHRIGVVGGDAEIFTPGALVALARLSDGIPRLINEIADRGLLGAYAGSRDRVSAGLVRRAATEVFGDPAPARRRPAFTVPGVVAVSAIVTAVAGWWLTSTGHDWSWVRAVVDRETPGRGDTATPVVVTIAPPPASTTAVADAPRTDALRPDVAVPVLPPVTVDPAALPSRQRPAAEAGMADGGDVALAPETGRAGSSGRSDDRVGSSGEAATDLQAWLETNGSALSFSGAMSELSQLWGAPAEGAATHICQAQGWSCLIRQGDWQLLSTLDLPVALRLTGDGQMPVFVALTGLTRQDAVVRVGGAEKRFPRWAFEPLWAGEFAVLWPAPEGWDLPVRPGQRGGASIPWARQRLAVLFARSLTTSGPPEVFDPQLEEAIGLFQNVNGIAAGGVLDAATLLQLYAADGTEARPRLWRED